MELSYLDWIIGQHEKSELYATLKLNQPTERPSFNCWKNILISTENFTSALLYLFGAYYSFNIKYPKLSYPVLIFFQKYVLGIQDGQVVPRSVVQAVTVMNRFQF